MSVIRHFPSLLEVKDADCDFSLWATSVHEVVNVYAAEYLTFDKHTEKHYSCSIEVYLIANTKCIT